MYRRAFGQTQMANNVDYRTRAAAAAHTLYTHPFSFALGIGIANGLLAVSRDKKLDMPVAVTLATILGLGEMAIEAFVPPDQRHHGLPAIGFYSVLGVAVGLAPFMWWSKMKEERGEELERGRPLLVAAREPAPAPLEPGAATAGWW